MTITKQSIRFDSPGVNIPPRTHIYAHPAIHLLLHTHTNYHAPCILPDTEDYSSVCFNCVYHIIQVYTLWMEATLTSRRCRRCRRLPAANDELRCYIHRTCFLGILPHKPPRLTTNTCAYECLHRENSTAHASSSSSTSVRDMQDHKTRLDERNTHTRIIFNLFIRWS